MCLSLTLLFNAYSEINTQEGKPKMPTEQREQLISLLIIWTGWNESVFENMTDREVAEHYDRYVGE